MADIDNIENIDFKGDYKVVSNHVGEDGESVDRIYGSGDKHRLIQRDYSEYKGTITKKTILVKGMDGKNFKSHIFVTDDGRYFDRGGLPISKESVEIEKDSDDATQD